MKTSNILLIVIIIHFIGLCIEMTKFDRLMFVMFCCTYFIVKAIERNGKD